MEVEDADYRNSCSGESLPLRLSRHHPNILLIEHIEQSLNSLPPTGYDNPAFPTLLSSSSSSSSSSPLAPWPNRIRLRAGLVKTHVNLSPLRILLSPYHSSYKTSLQMFSSSLSVRLGSGGLGSPNLESWMLQWVLLLGLWGTSPGKHAGR